MKPHVGWFAAALAAPVVWTLAASWIFVQLAGLAHIYPLPLYTWWFYVTWWPGNSSWTDALIVISGVLPLVPFVAPFVVRAMMRRGKRKRGDQALYGETAWASKDQAEERGFSFTRDM